jgi:hypothetical protein
MLSGTSRGNEDRRDGRDKVEKEGYGMGTIAQERVGYPRLCKDPKGDGMGEPREGGMEIWPW